MDKPYSPYHILSSNTKCGCSVNLPIKGHCTPTRVCAKACYARKGHCSRPRSLKKQIYISRYLKGNDISRLVGESRKWRAVRLSGTGDLQTEHVPNIIRLARACPDTQFWGMTRKLDIARMVNHKLPNLRLMVSVDSSSPASVWKYDGVLCWGPRLAEDLVPRDPRIRTVFPYHSMGRVVKAKLMPHDRRDCRAVWHEISGCQECGRCWT
jgi:hypothetical protein